MQDGVEKTKQTQSSLMKLFPVSGFGFHATSDGHDEGVYLGVEEELSTNDQSLKHVIRRNIHTGRMATVSDFHGRETLHFFCNTCMRYSGVLLEARGHGEQLPPLVGSTWEFWCRAGRWSTAASQNLPKEFFFLASQDDKAKYIVFWSFRLTQCCCSPFARTTERRQLQSMSSDMPCLSCTALSMTSVMKSRSINQERQGVVK